MEHRDASFDPINVWPPIAPDLVLELPISLRPAAFHFGKGVFGRLLRGHVVHRCAVGEFAHETHPNWLVTSLVQTIPAGGIERGFGVAMALHGMFHNLCDLRELPGVPA